MYLPSHTEMGNSFPFPEFSFYKMSNIPISFHITSCIIFELLYKALCTIIFCLDGKHRTGLWDLDTIWLLPSKLGRLFHGSQASYQTSCWAKCLSYNAMSTYCPKTWGLPTQPLGLSVLLSPSYQVSSC